MFQANQPMSHESRFCVLFSFKAKVVYRSLFLDLSRSFSFGFSLLLTSCSYEHPLVLSFYNLCDGGNTVCQASG